MKLSQNATLDKDPPGEECTGMGGWMCWVQTSQRSGSNGLSRVYPLRSCIIRSLISLGCDSYNFNPGAWDNSYVKKCSGPNPDQEHPKMQDFLCAETNRVQFCQGHKPISSFFCSPLSVSMSYSTMYITLTYCCSECEGLIVGGAKLISSIDSSSIRVSDSNSSKYNSLRRKVLNTAICVQHLCAS